MIHRDKWFEAFILLHLKPLASCDSLGLSLVCIVYIDNNILLHLKPLASCGSLVCKFEVSRPFQSYLSTDGTMNNRGLITREVTLDFVIGHQEQRETFLVTSLGSHES